MDVQIVFIRCYWLVAASQKTSGKVDVKGINQAM